VSAREKYLSNKRLPLASQKPGEWDLEILLKGRQPEKRNNTMSPRVKITGGSRHFPYTTAGRKAAKTHVATLKKQGYNARLDESLGMRRGKEAGKKMTMKGRRDVSKGVRKAAGKRPYNVGTMR